MLHPIVKRRRLAVVAVALLFMTAATTTSGFVAHPLPQVQQALQRKGENHQWFSPSTNCKYPLPAWTTKETALSAVVSSAKDADEDDNNNKKKENLARKIAFSSFCFGEIAWSYMAAPGHDGSLWPQADLDLLQNLLDPAVMNHGPPAGYALFSFVFFNSFLWLPFCWGGILYTERDNLPSWPFVLLSFPMAGISMYPYLAIRQPNYEQDVPSYANTLADSNLGKAMLIAFNAIGLLAFLATTMTTDANASNILDTVVSEWTGMIQLLLTSQFASTTASDVALLSVVMLDPLRLDAQKRGVLPMHATWRESLAKLLPYLVPIYGILLWIFTRPDLLPDKNDKGTSN